MRREQRYFDGMDLRVAKGTDGKSMLHGYAAVFNSRSQPLGSGRMKFREIIKPGSFKAALAEGADVRALVNHNPDMILGRTTAGTLRLKEDDKGLRFECDPPDTGYARDAITSIDRGDIRGVSFGMDPERCVDAWSRDADGSNLRTLTSIMPFDVSPTAFPAYTETRVDLRTILQGRRALGAMIGMVARNELRGQVPGSSAIISAARSAVAGSRYGFDYIQQLLDAVEQVNPEALDAAEIRALMAAAAQADDLGDLCDELCEACDGICGDDDAGAQADDPRDDDMGAGGEDRSGDVEQPIEGGEPMEWLQGRRISRRKLQALLESRKSRANLLAMDFATGKITRTQFVDNLLPLLREVRSGHMTRSTKGGTSLNKPGLANAHALIAAGKIDDGAWSFEAADGDKLLGDPPKWSEYGKWFLGIDPAQKADAKARYKYPFGKDGKIFRRAVAAINQRASQQDAGAIRTAGKSLADALSAKD